jgi:hypothetical protein
MTTIELLEAKDAILSGTASNPPPEINAARKIKTWAKGVVQKPPRIHHRPAGKYHGKDEDAPLPPVPQSAQIATTTDSVVQIDSRMRTHSESSTLVNQPSVTRYPPTSQGISTRNFRRTSVTTTATTGSANGHLSLLSMDRSKSFMSLGAKSEDGNLSLAGADEQEHLAGLLNKK